ncbi:transporter substrate-binding domain-containing protein [Inquilinus sp. CAU 1745]|uniref:transporter substrate-binding domain-containing protein n=1 Tax=Inquilinus sp. CAU 1745 TaxID=3140369 RepID=UPI00325BD09F
MRIMKNAISLLAGVGLLAGVAAAQAQTPEEIKERGEINIGMLVDFPPFGIINTEGEPDGYDADVAKLLAEDMGVSVNLVPVTGPNRIPYLLSGRVDLLVASLGITPERDEKVDYSEPYAGIKISVYGQEDLEIADAADLSGRTIGVARASTQDVAITEIAPEDANIQRFDDDASAVQALLSGQVELIGASNTVIAQLEQVAPDRFDTKFDLNQQVQGIAVRPGSDELRAYIDDFLGRVKESGELTAIHEKWLDAPLPDFVTQASAQ